MSHRGAGASSTPNEGHIQGDVSGMRISVGRMGIISSQ